MQALVYHGPGEKEWESKSDPTIEQPTDALVQIDTTTICGTDLHILKGDVPTVTDGRTLGHEAVGTVVESGSGVEDIKQGDKVLVSCISACGRCRYCRRGLQSQCLSGGGWVTGHPGRGRLHAGVRALQILQAGATEPVPERGRLDPGTPSGWDSGRIRPDAVC